MSGLPAVQQSALLPEAFATFAEPPADARPMVRWWWFGASMTTADIDDQLTSMHRSGLGGVELAFVYPLDPRPGPAFLSEEMLHLVGHATRRGRDLGLRVDLTLGSGWSYGGAHVPPALAAQRLWWDQRTIGPEAVRLPIGNRWPEEQVVAAYIGEGSPGEGPGDYQQLELTGAELVVPPGAGPRTVLLAVAGPTGQQVKRSANGAEGPVLDHYSAEAIGHHLREVGEPLLAAAGAENITAVFCDSLEVYHADWTAGLVAEFTARRGYDPLPLLYRLRVDHPGAAALRADYYRTLSELQEENFLTPVHAWAREHGVAFRVQNYGRPPARVSGYGCADLIEGEGWGWRGIPETRWASSAAHHLGRPVVSSETWTWVNSPSFRARPIDLKGEAHEHLLLGVNQLIGHGWPFSPRDAVDPGWAFYAAGALSDRNAWWPAAPALFGYLTRLSALLRTGEPVADVALWLPYEDVYAGFGPDRPADLWRGSVAQIGDQVPAMLREAGYDFDVIDAQTPVESITRRHRVVVLAGSTILSTQDADQLRAIAAAGCPVVVVDSPVLPEARHIVITELLSAIGDVVGPDAVTDHPDVGVLHQRHEAGEVYLVVNTGPRPAATRLQPRTPYGSWEAWDAHSGAVTHRGSGEIRLALAPYEAVVVVTSPRPPRPPLDRERSHPRTESLHGSHGGAFATGGGGAGPTWELRDWQLTEPGGRVRSVRVPHVWEEDGLDGVVGTATYTTTVTIEGAPPEHLVLDPVGLPVPPRTARQPQSYQAHAAEPLGVVAAVLVNGQDAGVIWDHPYRLRVGHLLQPGENHLELQVGGTSVAGLRDERWRQVYRAATAAHGRRFTMQEIDLADEPTRTGIFVVPQLR